MSVDNVSLRNVVAFCQLLLNLKCIVQRGSNGGWTVRNRLHQGYQKGKKQYKITLPIAEREKERQLRLREGM